MTNPVTASTTPLAAPELPSGVTVSEDGKKLIDERSWFHFGGESLQSLQNNHDEYLKSVENSEKPPVWKRPFIFLKSSFFSVFNFLKDAVQSIFCYGKKSDSTEAKASDKAGETSSASADSTEESTSESA